jgi:hypothetical protein
MSVVSLLVFPPEKLPTLEQIAQEAMRGGDQIAFPQAVDLRSLAGFLPVRVMGRDTGFEHFFEPLPANGLPPELRAHGSHHIIARTGASFEEGRAALVYLKVAARLTGGVYVYPDDAIIVGPDALQAYLTEQIVVYGKFIS